jgi:hypothetical protein
MGSGHAPRGQEQFFPEMKSKWASRKSGKSTIFQCGTHLAKKLFCMSGNQLGLTTQQAEPWMATGGQPRDHPKKRETDDGSGTAGTAEG